MKLPGAESPIGGEIQGAAVPLAESLGANWNALAYAERAFST